MRPGAFNDHQPAKRHRCCRCKRVRSYTVMQPVTKLGPQGPRYVTSKNKRDALWRCIDCNAGRRKKK